MERILVAVDFSKASAQAIGVALQLSQTWKAELQILHVVPTFVQAYEMGPAWRLDPSVIQKELDEFVAEALSGVDAAQIKRQVVEGPTVKMVLEEVSRFGASLLVVGSHGRTALGRVLLGSVSSGIVQRSGVPVLVVRSAQVGKPERILAALEVDGSAEAVIKSADAWQQMLGATVDFIHVWDDVPEPILVRFHPESSVLEQMLANRERVRTQISSLLQSHLASQEARQQTIFLDGDPDARICDEAMSGDYDLVIVGTHEKHDWLDWSNTAMAIVHHCEASLLVVRPLPTAQS